ncbi:hypothetical protein MOVI109754_03565 [Moritella viscosa]
MATLSSLTPRILKPLVPALPFCTTETPNSPLTKSFISPAISLSISLLLISILALFNIGSFLALTKTSSKVVMSDEYALKVNIVSGSNISLFILINRFIHLDVNVSINANNYHMGNYCAKYL